MEVSTENLDVKVKSMHPKLSTALKWPSRDDLCQDLMFMFVA